MTEPTSILDLTRSIELNFKDICSEKGIEFKVEIGEDVPDTIYIDMKRVAQIIKNLVSNAVKFTVKGYVKLMFSLPDQLPEGMTEPGAFGDCLLITVEDTGTGIPVDKQQVVFEAFRQVDGTISRKYGGTGLGLSISRELVHLMGGEIVLESAEGRGSIFRVFIPDVLAPGKKERPLILETPPNPGITEVPSFKNEEQGTAVNGTQKLFAGKKILIVDDDMRHVYAMLHALGEENTDILVVRTDMECMEMLKRDSSIHLVILDVKSDMNGLKVVDEIRSVEPYGSVPVIVMTGATTDVGRDACIRSGASEYLLKPVDMDRLISAMKEMLGGEARGEG
jgi:two-component system chemotaxis sensor kinase CheA